MTQPLQELTSYITSTWLENPLWPSLSWSVFGRVIHTNNDVEGWHCRLNQKAQKGQLPFYLLVHLLHEETKWINIQVRLVLENKLTRQEERCYSNGRYNQKCSVFGMTTHMEKYQLQNYSMPVQSWYMSQNKPL